MKCDHAAFQPDLKSETHALLGILRSRREMRLRDKGPNGWWRFSRHRVRSVSDYARIADFPRCPKSIREACAAKVHNLIRESRRFERLIDQ